MARIETADLTGDPPGPSISHELDRTDDRKDDRPDDREDDTDRAIKLARGHAIEAVELLVWMMRLEKAPGEDRSRCAIALLEVAGCL